MAEKSAVESAPEASGDRTSIATWPFIIGSRPIMHRALFMRTRTWRSRHSSKAIGAAADSSSQSILIWGTKFAYRSMGSEAPRKRARGTGNYKHPSMYHLPRKLNRQGRPDARPEIGRMRFWTGRDHKEGSYRRVPRWGCRKTDLFPNSNKRYFGVYR